MESMHNAAPDKGTAAPTSTVLFVARPPVAALELRAAKPGDAARLRRMFWRLSPVSLLRYFFVAVPHTPYFADRLARLAEPGEAGCAIVAASGDEVIGIACCVRAPGDESADVGVVIEDAWQGRGLGRRLLAHLELAARRRGLAAVKGALLAENRRALRLVRSIAPDATLRLIDGEWHFAIPLDQMPYAPASSQPTSSAEGDVPPLRGESAASQPSPPPRLSSAADDPDLWIVAPKDELFG